ncbi:MAG: hypothetical protein Fues2KO_14410 [Fuerstiella sp.]
MIAVRSGTELRTSSETVATVVLSIAGRRAFGLFGIDLNRYAFSVSGLMAGSLKFAGAHL